jgi:hypothetical protein
MKVVCGFPLFDKRSEAVNWYAEKYSLPKSIASHVISTNVETIKKFENLRFLKGQELDDIEFVNNCLIKDAVDGVIIPAMKTQLELSGIYYELTDFDFIHIINGLLKSKMAKAIENIDTLMNDESFTNEESVMNKIFYFSSEFGNMFRYITLKKSEIKFHLQNSSSLDALTKFVALYDDPEDENDFIQIRLYPDKLENICTLSDILFAL